VRVRKDVPRGNISACPIKDAKGASSGIENRSRHHRAQAAQEALSKSEAWRRLLFESVKDFAIFSTNQQGQITD